MGINIQTKLERDIGDSTVTYFFTSIPISSLSLSPRTPLCVLGHIPYMPLGLLVCIGVAHIYAELHHQVARVLVV